uniref:MAM domain-containing protein n=1 Tax=Setaria digitata TaxID=48799 RepID=A0A915PPR4_9BILA
MFVTTSDLPPYSINETDSATASYNCTFGAPCRWFSEGTTPDRWLLAKGEPDPFLWLASMGTIQRPAEPFALIKLRGQQADRLISHKIHCQENTAILSFFYWIAGGANLEVCLISSVGKKFNCTAMLGTRSMPRKVLLPVPQIQEAFQIAIIPNIATGIVAIDNIEYDATPCRKVSAAASIPIVENEKISSFQVRQIENWS